MLSIFDERRFVSRLNPAGMSTSSPRVETILAFSRLFLGLTALIASQLQALAPPYYNRLAILLLVLYTVYSLALLGWLKWQPAPGKMFVQLAQAGDTVWPILLCLFTDAPTSIFFTFFLFALTAVAFRWGLRETAALSLIISTVLIVQALIVAKGPRMMQHLLFTDFEIHRMVVRIGYVLLTGVLLGYLSETEKELRAEIGFTNRLLSEAQGDKRFAHALADAGRAIMPVFAAGKAWCVIWQTSTGRVFRWDIPSRLDAPALVREISPKSRASAMLSEHPHTFYARQGRRGLHVCAVDDEGRAMATEGMAGFEVPDGGTSVLCVRVEMGNDWQGRFFMHNAKIGTSCERELRFAQHAMRQVAPALYSLYLFRHFRNRAGAMERARVARELHDTAIQSLIGIEMQVDVLRRQPKPEMTVRSDLERIQCLLRKEILNLRELMQSMRPIDIGPHQFLDFTAQLVERFRRDTGIDARFVSELQEVRLPAPVCQELARVVQEGLVNIRKHSNAKAAYVRFGTQNGHWELIIDDDGHGFPFTGKMSLAELDEFHRGPAVIRERVRSIGGDMVLESKPGHGSRLEVKIPQKGNPLYG